MTQEKGLTLRKQADVVIDRCMEMLPHDSVMRNRFKGAAVALALRDTAFANCSKESVFQAIFDCAKMNMVPDRTLGYVYIIPRGNTAQVQLGYRGLVELARRSGHITQVKAAVVYEGDDFDYNEASFDLPTHRPYFLNGNEPGQRVGAYCIWKQPDGETGFTFVHRTDIEQIKAHAKRQGGKVWDQWEDEQWKKTAIRRASKLWRLDPDDQERIDFASRIEEGRRHPDDIIDAEPTLPSTGQHSVTRRKTDPGPEPEKEEGGGVIEDSDWDSGQASNPAEPEVEVEVIDSEPAPEPEPDDEPRRRAPWELQMEDQKDPACGPLNDLTKALTDAGASEDDAREQIHALLKKWKVANKKVSGLIARRVTAAANRVTDDGQIAPP